MIIDKEMQLYILFTELYNVQLGYKNANIIFKL